MTRTTYKLNYEGDDAIEILAPDFDSAMTIKMRYSIMNQCWYADFVQTDIGLDIQNLTLEVGASVLEPWRSVLGYRLFFGTSNSVPLSTNIVSILGDILLIKEEE